MVLDAIFPPVVLYPAPMVLVVPIIGELNCVMTLNKIFYIIIFYFLIKFINNLALKTEIAYLTTDDLTRSAGELNKGQWDPYPDIYRDFYLMKKWIICCA